jgi:hypothetical protein
MEKVPNLMTVPNPDDADTIGQIMTKLGKPTAAEAYTLPDGVQFEGEFLGRLKAEAHAMDLTQAQFAKQVEAVYQAQQTQQQAVQTRLEEDKALLQKEWGPAYQDRMKAVENFLQAEGAPQDMAEAFTSGQLNAGAIKWLHNISQLTDESPQYAVQKDGEQERVLDMTETLEQVTELENRIFGNRALGIPAMRPEDPQYQMLVDKRLRLMKSAYPEGMQ